MLSQVIDVLDGAQGIVGAQTELVREVLCCFFFSRISAGIKIVIVDFQFFRRKIFFNTHPSIQI